MWYILTIENNGTLKTEYRAGAKQKRVSGALTLQGYAREYGTPNVSKLDYEFYIEKGIKENEQK